MKNIKKEELTTHYPRPHEVAPSIDVSALQDSYRASPLESEEDTFALIRIIGNDLPPRHKLGQGRMNLEFTLEHESEFDGCTKIWLLNRIVEPTELTKLRALLERHGREYHEIPFDENEYGRVDWDIESFPSPAFLESREFSSLNDDRMSMAYDQLYRHKNNYVMHNNGARNVALRLGRSRAKWVLPWDGNCFLTDAAWAAMRSVVVSKPFLKYFIVPMARVTENQHLLDPALQPNAVEEPQILFRRDVEEEFNEAYRYGRRPKVEMLWRLGVSGPWDRWRNNSWDVPFPRLCSDAGQFATAGWVARLNSGFKALEQDDKVSFKSRGHARQSAVREFLDNLDSGILAKQTNPGATLILSLERLHAQKRAWRAGDKNLAALINRLSEDAEQAMRRERLSVVDKTTLPPSGDAHDYWHPAPYWWPNPDRDDGLPYVRRDGHRVPGTQMYEPDGVKYDRTRAQYLFDDVTILALSAFFLEQPRYAKRAEEMLRVWFVDESTRMNPHLQYAQVRMGHNKNNGMSTGLIEFKDLYYMLDAVKLLQASGEVDSEVRDGLRSWFADYLKWLKESKQGCKERAANNNHGVLYDVQVIAVAHFMGDWCEVNHALRRARDRVGEHFALDGRQPHELMRTMSLHYCAFNLQSWANLAAMASGLGFDLWSYVHPRGASLEAAFRWLLKHRDAEWPYQQIEPFDLDRLAPLATTFSLNYINWAEDFHFDRQRSQLLVKPRFWPHDGIRPYWQLG